MADLILLDRRAAAAALSISLAALDRHAADYRRSAGRIGIPHARLGGRTVRFRSADLDAWVAAQVRATAGRGVFSTRATA